VTVAPGTRKFTAIFFGTPEIAVPALEALDAIAEVAAVICQPDRPAGRGLELKAPAVKERALALGLPVHQPQKIKTPELAAWLRALDADVALVMAYGRILPPALLQAPKRGCLNLHASLLPKYRGAAPIQWAVARGETETGISLMEMDEGLDTGPVLVRRALAIGADETAGDLAARLAELAAAVVRDDLPRAVGGEIQAVPQDHAAATHAPMLSKDDGRVDWSHPATAVHAHVRGMTPWPGAHTTAHGKRFKILATRLGPDERHGAEPGTILRIGEDAVVACGHGTVRLLRGQVEGKKALGAAELAAGRTIAAGMRLGE
jgi:methionyl-tRNA formyltransferase